ncbi:hypothetical protein AKO1_002388 [Acrasis kona]|uniref:Uncharacterized protein n=1 Tax=Acrasis kona TaxID=1008807 RepID=A0AAW2Z3T8_9EUKA
MRNIFVFILVAFMISIIVAEKPREVRPVVQTRPPRAAPDIDCLMTGTCDPDKDPDCCRYWG